MFLQETVERTSLQLEQLIKSLKAIQIQIKQIPIPNANENQWSSEEKHLRKQAEKTMTNLRTLVSELETLKTQTLDELRKPHTNQRWLTKAIDLQLQTLKAHYEKFATIKKSIDKIECQGQCKKTIQITLNDYLDQILEKLDENEKDSKLVMDGFNEFYRKHKWVSETEQKKCKTVKVIQICMFTDLSSD